MQHKFSIRMKAGVAGLVAMAIVFAMGAGSPATAQTQTQQPAQQPISSETFGAWQLRCGQLPGATEESCILSQDLIDQNSQRPLMQVAIGHFGQQRQPGTIITLPLGIRLPPGIEVKVDGVTVGNLAFRQCSPPPVNGCQATLILDKGILDLFKAGNTGTARFQDTLGQTIEIPFSLSGFTAGYNKVR